MSTQTLTPNGPKSPNLWRLAAQALALSERLRERIDSGPSMNARAWNRYVRRLSAFYASKNLAPSLERALVDSIPDGPGPAPALNPNAGIVAAYPGGRYG